MASGNVAFVRPELRSNLLKMYYLIRDVLEGELTVKGKKTLYLPMIDPADKTKDNLERYEAYLKRAVFYNVARRTMLGLLGQVFAIDPTIKLPSLLAPIEANATGSGINLKQLSKQAVSYNLAYSRGGIFADYPPTEDSGGASVADLQTGKIRPTLYCYSPMQIINWRTVDMGAEEVLALVVIWESYCLSDDGFEMKNAGQFRVLRLDEDGYYVHELWRERNSPQSTDGYKLPNNASGYERVENLVFYPTDANGNRLDRIPFWFFGSENNDPNPDNPNFYDLASLNIAHYRNSADYEEACHIVGQPTAALIGVTQDWIDTVLKGEIRFGSRGGVPLPSGGDLKLVQAEERTMMKEAMDTKERQMVAIGAKLVEQKTVQRTATEASIETASETSTLKNVTQNVSDAILAALQFAAEWVGASAAEVDFKLNDDFEIARMSPDERRSLIEEWQKGAITFEEMRTELRKSGIAREDDEAAKAKIKKEEAEQLALVAAQMEQGDPSNVGNGDGNGGDS